MKEYLQYHECCNINIIFLLLGILFLLHVYNDQFEHVENEQVLKMKKLKLQAGHQGKIHNTNVVLKYR